MDYKGSAAKLAQYRQQIADVRAKMREVQAAIEPQEVQDYEFSSAVGGKRLSELFGKYDTLFVVHNMGRAAPIARCGRMGSMVSSTICEIAPLSSSLRQIPPMNSRNSRRAAAGDFRWFQLRGRALRTTWATAGRMCRCPEFPYLSARTVGWCACRIPRSRRATTSAPSGISLISFRKGQPVGDHDSNIDSAFLARC